VGVLVLRVKLRWPHELQVHATQLTHLDDQRVRIQTVHSLKDLCALTGRWLGEVALNSSRS
jgi:hypothetical protein